MITRLYVIGILCIGAVAGFLLDLTVELTGHPWWFLLMMLICALSPGPVAFAVAIKKMINWICAAAFPYRGGSNP